MLCDILGVLDVLHCVLIDSPEALNVIKEQHIRTIISLIDKHGRDPKVSKKKFSFDSHFVQNCLDELRLSKQCIPQTDHEILVLVIGMCFFLYFL